MNFAFGDGLSVTIRPVFEPLAVKTGLALGERP
jgi:hypothetical protein